MRKLLVFICIALLLGGIFTGIKFAVTEAAERKLLYKGSLYLPTKLQRFL